MVAHTLGNPFDLTAVSEFCRKHDLWLIEDNCDALGSRYAGRIHRHLRRSEYAELSTRRIIMTLGEGGAVNIVRNAALIREVEIVPGLGPGLLVREREGQYLRPAVRMAARRLAGWLRPQIHLQSSGLQPQTHRSAGRDWTGATTQAALVHCRAHCELGVSSRRPGGSRRVFEFMLPTHATGWKDGRFIWTEGRPKVEPSWFAFMLLVRPDAPFSRTDLAQALEQARIGNRMLFGGNLTRQPAFMELRRSRPDQSFRVAGKLDGADRMMCDAIFVGTYPGLSAIIWTTLST